MRAFGPVPGLGGRRRGSLSGSQEAKHRAGPGRQLAKHAERRVLVTETPLIRRAKKDPVSAGAFAAGGEGDDP